MKTTLITLVLVMGVTSLFAQSVDLGNIEAGTVDVSGEKVRFNLEDDGLFVIADASDATKLLFYESGLVNLFLDGQDFWIRDSDFEAFPGIFTPYDFLHVDGGTGRIGFNVLADPQYKELPLTSSIHLMGSIATRVRTLDGANNYEVAQDDYNLIVNLNSGNRVLDLPQASSCTGRTYKIKRDASDGNANSLILDAFGDELIDGSATYEVSKTLGVVEIVCDGTQWWILSAGDQFAQVTIDADRTLSRIDNLVWVNFANDNDVVSLTLPPASDFKGKEYTIKRNYDGVVNRKNVLTLLTTGSDLIDALPLYVMANDFEAVTVISSGTRWVITGSHGH